MSTSALKSVVTGSEIATTDKPKKTIASLLTDPVIKQQMALAMPRHMTADRLARIALTEVRKVPKLATCDQTSFLGAIMQCAQLGLEPGGALGHAYLLPFEKRKKVGQQWVTERVEVQLIIGYRGMIDLARRSGQIQSIEARSVHQKDQFDVELGLDSRLVHKPAWNEVDRGPLTFVYAVAKLKDGGIQFEVMSRTEIEKVRAQSKAKDSGPWVSHFDEMAKKTVIRRLFKYLPVSIEMQRAVGLDEQADAGIPQHNGMLIDGDFERIGADPSGATDTGELVIDAKSIRAALHLAETVDELDQQASFIGDIEDETERHEINELYLNRRADLEQQ